MSNSGKQAKPWQSKLCPYARQIALWRGEAPPKTYVEIAALLHEKYGVEVHPDTVNSFVLVRHRAARKKKQVAKLPKQIFEEGVGESLPSPPSPRTSQGKNQNREDMPPTHYLPPDPSEL
jgi:hypothetical protein